LNRLRRDRHPGFISIWKWPLPLCGFLFVAGLLFTKFSFAHFPELRNRAGLQMTVDAEDRNPALLVTVPEGPVNDRSFKILLPEHVTVRASGQTEATHLYLFRPGAQGSRPEWKKVGNTLEYASDFDGIHFVSHATLMEDGILFRYEFVNRSATDYDMITAITDPRFRAVFYDPRLERTYVHHTDGFDLLGSETPERINMPLGDWFPVRYLASYSIPVPAERLQRRDDGITYRYKSRPVDVPMIATLSADRKWVAASFSRDPGNVWSNPELTCQHVDPQVVLPHDGHAQYELKLLIFKGSLEDALHKVTVQQKTLQ